MKKNKIFIAAGGTGGHIFPALNAGKFLRENGYEIIFIGRKESFEEKVYKDNGFEMKYIEISGIKGKNFKERLKSILKLNKAIFKSLKILKETKPEIVLGFGGYISFPVIFASKILRIKNAIFEQNAVMGFANRMSAYFSDKIFLNFVNTYKVNKKDKCEVIGNFIKREILMLRNEKNVKDTILVFGGSQGAEKINEIFIEAIEKLKEIKFKIVHITGERDFVKVKNSYLSKGFNFIEVLPFTNKMEEYYKRAKVVISRAGATSITEFYALGLNAILIPYPFAADNHQWFNAAEYLKTGKGVLLEQRNLNVGKLLKWINFFLENDYRFKGKLNVLGNPFTAYEKLLNWVK